MSSASPPPTSPAKRPHADDRRLSTNSLSSSAKHGTQKAHGHHVGGSKRPHTRNTSYGRALAKAGRINSTQNLGEDGGRQHRKKFSNSIPTTSPRAPAVRRNNSHVALAKNSSHVNLRKNKSATAIARNLSHTQLQRKAGLGPAAPKQRKDTSMGFELGDMSSDEAGEDEEEEWEDSATQSPKLTRTNSATESQPGRPTTADRNNPNAGLTGSHPDRTSSSPPEPSIRHNRSAPSLGARASSASPVRPPDSPTNLPKVQSNPHSTKAAPPAISSMSAQASRDPLPRIDSTPTHVSHADTNHAQSTALLNIPSINKTPQDSSMPDGGVSHFLSSKATPVQRHHRTISSGSDYDSPSSFLPTFPPQQQSSPKKAGGDISGRAARAPTSNSTGAASRQETANPRTTSTLPSRTQQRLELQRRETMRASAPSSPATPLITNGHPRGSSSASLHSRSGSHGPSHGTDPNSAAAARLMMKQDYEASEKQLGVVRRFRNPIVEAVGRLKEKGLLTQGTAEGGDVKKTGAKKGRGGKSDLSLKTAAAAGGRSSLERKDAPNRAPNRTPPDPSRLLSRGEGSRSGPASTGGGRKVQFRRQGSHDDIGLSRSQGSYDDPDADHDNGAGGRVAGDSGLSPEEEMMRRMWESREVYDRGEKG